MKGGGHTDYGGGFADAFPHGVLTLVHIGVNLGQGAVVADGTHQHKGHLLFHAAVHDAVVDAFLVDEFRDGAVKLHLVDGVDVVVMAVGLGVLGVDVLAQGGF